MRLLRVELHRLTSRSLVVVCVLASLVGVSVLLAGVWSALSLWDEDVVAQAEEAYAEARADWAENGDEVVEACLADQQAERDAVDDDTIDFGCEQMEPQLDWFLPPSMELDVTLPGHLANLAVLLVVVLLVIGTTSTAAEMSTGSMGTWLTFVPRRIPVLVAKLTAAGLVAVPIGAVVLAIGVPVLWWLHERQGLADAMTRELWVDAAATGLRVVVLGVAAAVVGAALGILLRHTAAVLGVVLGYAVLGELVLRASAPRLQPGLVGLNVQAWVQGGATYAFEECQVEPTGTFCDYTEASVGMMQGGAYLGALVIVVVAVTAVVFARRDVT